MTVTSVFFVSGGAAWVKGLTITCSLPSLVVWRFSEILENKYRGASSLARNKS